MKTPSHCLLYRPEFQDKDGKELCELRRTESIAFTKYAQTITAFHQDITKYHNLVWPLLPNYHILLSVQMAFATAHVTKSV